MTNSKGFPNDKSEQRNYAQRALLAGSVKPAGIMFYNDTLTAMKRLSDEEIGKLIRALAAHRIMGVEPDFSEDRLLDILYEATVQKVDLDALNYALRIVRNRYNGSGIKTKDSNGKSHVDREDFDQWFKKVFESEDEIDYNDLDYYEGYDSDSEPEYGFSDVPDGFED